MFTKQHFLISSFLFGLVGLGNSVTFDNHFKNYAKSTNPLKEIGEFRSVKDLTFTDKYIYAVNGRASHSGAFGQGFGESSHQEPLFYYDRNGSDFKFTSIGSGSPIAALSSLTNSDDSAMDNSAKAKYSCVSASTWLDENDNEKEILFVASSNGEVRKYDGTEWRDRSESHENLPYGTETPPTNLLADRFSANVMEKYTKDFFDYTILGLSEVDTDANGYYKATLFDAVMDGGANADWSEYNIYKDQNVTNGNISFRLPVIDIQVSRHTDSGEQMFYVLVNDGLGTSGNTVGYYYQDVTNSNFLADIDQNESVNGVWMYKVEDGSANNTEINFHKVNFTGSNIGDENSYLTKLGYASPYHYDGSAFSTYENQELIYGIYNTPRESDVDPTEIYLTKEYSPNITFGSGVLMMNYNVGTNTFSTAQNYNFSDDGTTTNVEKLERANFLTDIEIVYDFDSSNPIFYISDYGNGLFRLKLNYSDLFASTPTAATWSTGKEFLKDVRENPDRGVFVLENDSENGGVLYSGAFRSLNKVDPQPSDGNWETALGKYDPGSQFDTKGIIFASVMFSSFEQEDGEPPVERGVVVTPGSVYINMDSGSNLDSPDWRFYFSPGGTVTSVSIDRFGTVNRSLGQINDCQVDNPGGNSLDLFLDALAVGVLLDEYEHSTNISSDKYHSIYTVGEYYTQTVSGNISTQEGAEAGLTNYHMEPKPVNDIIVQTVQCEMFIIAGIGACPTTTCAGDFGFIIGGIPSDLQTYASSNNTGYSGAPSKDTEINKLAYFSDSTPPPSGATGSGFTTADFFDNGYKGIYGINDNEIWEVFLLESASIKDINSVNVNSLSEVSGTLNDITLLNRNYVTDSNLSQDDEDLYFSIAVCTDEGVYITRRVNHVDLYSGTSFYSILSSSMQFFYGFKDVTTGHFEENGSNRYQKYIAFGERPLFSVNEQELFCIAIDASIPIGTMEEKRDVLYTNNAALETYQPGSGGLGVDYCALPTIVEENRDDLDWLVLTQQPKARAVWYSNESERGIQNNSNCDLLTEIFPIGDYDKRVFVSNVAKNANGGAWATKTDEIFKIDDFDGVMTNNSIVELKGSFWVDIENDIELTSGETLKLIEDSGVLESSTGLFLYSKTSPNRKINLNGGTLESANGTISSTRQKAPSRTDDTDSRTDNDWEGIVISGNNSTIDITDTKIANCKNGILKNSATVFSSVNLDLVSSEINNVKENEISLENLTTKSKEQIKVNGCRFNGSDFGTVDKGVYLDNVNFSGTEKDYGISIKDCRFEGTRDFGVYLDSSSDIEVVGDTLGGVINYDAISVNGCSRSKIKLFDNVIDGVVIGGSLKPVYGIYAKNSKTDIQDNKIYDSKYGVFLHLDTESTVQGNHISGDSEKSIAGIALRSTSIFTSGTGVKVYDNRDIVGYPKAILALSNFSGMNLDVGKEDDWNMANKINSNSYAISFEDNASGFTSKIRRSTAFEQQNRFIYVSSNNSSSSIDAGLSSEDKGENSFDPLNSSEPPKAFDKSVRVENLSSTTTVHAIASLNYL